MIQLHATIRKQPKRLQWTWQPKTKTLTALDPLASAVGYLEQAPRKRPAAQKAAPARKAAAKKPARKTAAKKPPAKKPPAKKTTAKKTTAKKPAEAANQHIVKRSSNKGKEVGR